MSAPSVVGIRTVGVKVTDQDRALGFFVDTLGFEKRLDAITPAMRWVEVAPPGATTTVALIADPAEPFEPRDTGIRLGVVDAEAAYGGMVDRGVTVGELLRWPGMPAMYVFEDLD